MGGIKSVEFVYFIDMIQVTVKSHSGENIYQEPKLYFISWLVSICELFLIYNWFEHSSFHYLNNTLTN